jgi:hypothetical protein
MSWPTWTLLRFVGTPGMVIAICWYEVLKREQNVERKGMFPMQWQSTGRGSRFYKQWNVLKYPKMRNIHALVQTEHGGR